MKPNHLLLGILIAFIWGSNVIAAKMATAVMPPIFSAALRFGLSALLILPFSHKTSTPIWRIALIGQFWGTLFFSCVQTGLSMGINANICVVIQQMAVPLTALIGMGFYGEPRRITTILGIFIALAGIYILKGSPNVLENKAAFFFILGAALNWAISTIMIRQCQEENAIAFVGWMSFFATPTLLLLSISSPWLPILGDELSLIPSLNFMHPQLLLSIGYMTIFATVLANTWWSILLKLYPAGKVVAFMLLMPVSGILTAYYILDEQFSEQGMFGAAMILLGMACILFPGIFHSFTKLRKSHHIADKL